MNFLKITVLGFLLNACGLTQAVRQSSHEESQALAQHAEEGSPFHSLTGWHETIKFYLASDVPDQVIISAQNAANSWNDAIGHVILSFGGITDSKRGESLYDSLNDASTVIYYEGRWKLTTGKSQLTLATTIWENDGSSDQIIKGDIILNAENYKFVDANAPELSTSSDDAIVDAESVLLHEMGHLLGLDHVEDENDPHSVMHAKTFIGPSFTFRVLSEGDKTNIRTIYP